MLGVVNLLMGRWRPIFLQDSSRCSSYFLLRRSSTIAAAKSDATRSRSSNSEANTSVPDIWNMIKSNALNYLSVNLPTHNHFKLPGNTDGDADGG